MSEANWLFEEKVGGRGTKKHNTNHRFVLERLWVKRDCRDG
jgi:hypothetical protein